MSNRFKDIDIKKLHILWYYNIKKFDPNKIKIDEKLYKNILFYNIGYVTIKYSKYLKINSVNPLNLIMNRVKEYFEEMNKNNYQKR